MIAHHRMRAAILVLLTASPAAAQLTPDESSELARLQDRERDFAEVQARVESGESAVVANPRAGGSPWLEVPRGDPASMISSLLLTGDVTSEDAVRISRDMGTQMRLGRQRLESELSRVRGRIRLLESRDLGRGATLASGDRHEKWRFAMVGRFDRTGSPMNSTGTLDLEFAGGGRVYGTAHYDSQDAWDDDVSGTVQDGRVRIEYGASNSVTRGVFTGAIDPAGTSASGEFRISGSIDARGTWRATRPPDAPAVAAGGAPRPASPGDPDPPPDADPAVDAVEDSLLGALMPNSAEWDEVRRKGIVPVDKQIYIRQMRENQDRASREIFGRDYSALSPAEQLLAGRYGRAMDLSVIPDRTGARAFPGVAASLPVIGRMARSAQHDPEAVVALTRYLALLQRMDVADLRQRHGLDAPAPALP